MRGGTVATTSSRALVSAYEKLGHDGAALLSATEITREELDDLDGRLPGERVTRLWQEALRLSADPSLPLRAAEGVPFGAYRVIDFLGASAPTVGQALERVALYFPLINTAVELRVATGNGQHCLQIVNREGPNDVPRPYAEYTLAVTVLQTRRVTRVPFPLDEVRFAFPRAANVADHERVFGCRVSFEAPQNEIVLADATWNTPTAGASPDMFRVLETHADRLLAVTAQNDGTRSAVARLIAEELRGGDPTLERVAQRMALTPRTLQRRLSAESCSFADVLDGTRRVLADCYVREPGVQLTEVAYMLGFSEPSAFSRAFQRWYGMSPSRYRSAR